MKRYEKNSKKLVRNGTRPVMARIGGVGGLSDLALICQQTNVRYQVMAGQGKKVSDEGWVVCLIIVLTPGPGLSKVNCQIPGLPGPESLTIDIEQKWDRNGKQDRHKM